MSKPIKVMVCDDSKSILIMMKSILNSLGFVCDTSLSIEGCERMLKKNSYDLLFLDVHFPGENGIEFLKRLSNKTIPIKTIIMTSSATVDQAVEAMKIGAVDYLSKPITANHVKAIIENFCLKPSSDQDYIYESGSLRMKEVEDQISKVAGSKVAICLTGETGVGKEVFAKKIHQLSKFSQGPFVAVNCPAIPRNLFESELFGHKKGAFTGADSDRKGKMELANQGTLFFDEVADLNLQAQAKLLRVLQEMYIEPVGSNKSVQLDLRVLCATSQNLKELVADGSFRSDLYYRLCQFEIIIPSLRQRKEDIGRYVQLFAESYCRENEVSKKRFTSEAIEYLEEYSWPGNIRELKNMIYRILILCRTDEVSLKSIPENLMLQQASIREDHQANSLSMPQDLVSNEKALVESALKENKYNISKTAKQLNIGRTTLYRKMKKYGF